MNIATPMLEPLLQRMARECTLCGVCQKQCAFLQALGLPGDIARRLLESGTGLLQAILDDPDLPFGCSLCDLCSTLCPEKLPIADMFLALRRELVAHDRLEAKRYSGILSYERRGHSALFAWYGLPQDCRTVFFPGCTLPGTRSRATRLLFDSIRAQEPTAGIVLDCCAKPSHDLGRHEHFTKQFGEIYTRLRERGVRTVLTACPNCYKVFRKYGEPLEVVTVWEWLEQLPAPQEQGKQTGKATEFQSREVAVHDPCPHRRDPGVHAAVRGLVQSRGLALGEMRHRGPRTYCCGEGGSVSHYKPELAQNWTQRRVREAEGRLILTYCAGCAGYLGRETPTAHLADLLFFPESTLNGTNKPTRSPFTYLARLRLKAALKRLLKS